MDNKDRILSRLKKLLELAERGGTEAEADTAMLKVQELLTKYNLSLGDIKFQDDATEFERHDIEYEFNQSWIAIVYNTVAKLYFCKLWTEKRNNCHKVVLLGSPVNTYSAMYVAKIIVDNGKKLARAYANGQYKATGTNSVSSSNSFKKGYAERISSRSRELIREAKEGRMKNSETGTNIVVADLYDRIQRELEEHIKNKLGVRLTSSVKRSSVRDQFAANAGRSAADQQNLRANGIHQSATKTYLIGA